MLKRLSKWVLDLLGWKIAQLVPREVKKCVIVVAPHTSNYDYIFGRLGFFVQDMPVKFLIKKEAFIFPFGALMKAWGGIPIDRHKNNRVIEYVAGLYNKSEQLYVVITPEGTRSLNPRWRRGFYLIAQRAKVPIALTYIDYRKKEMGFGGFVEPSGNYAEDLAKIEDFYRDKTPRHPEKFNLKPKS